MKTWQVEIEGADLPEIFATEDEANQAAANARGQDWDKKIRVHESDYAGPIPTKSQAPTPEAPPVVAIAESKPLKK